MEISNFQVKSNKQKHRHLARLFPQKHAGPALEHTEITEKKWALCAIA
jgi:hypothetical protein